LTSATIVVCRDPKRAEWNLGALPPPVGRMTLIGWRVTPEPDEAGVPGEVANVLVQTFAAVGRATFPSSTLDSVSQSSWSRLGEDYVRGLPAQGLTGRLRDVLKGLPQQIVLISTRQPLTMRRLFDDAAYPWWLQGQVALLSEPESQPPKVEREGLLGLMASDWMKRAGALIALGVRGIIRPGVDGDVAGLLSLTDSFDESFLKTLESETRRAGLDWMVLPEKDFAAAL
jgi:hypothetical protein